MTKTCAFKGCDSGFRRVGKAAITKKKTIFSFPKSSDLKKKWLEFIGENIANTNNKGVCEDHFQPRDFDIVHQMTLEKTDKGKTFNVLLPVKKLRKGAVPKQSFDCDEAGVKENNQSNEQGAANSSKVCTWNNENELETPFEVNKSTSQRTYTPKTNRTTLLTDSLTRDIQETDKENCYGEVLDLSLPMVDYLCKGGRDVRQTELLDQPISATDSAYQVEVLDLSTTTKEKDSLISNGKVLDLSTATKDIGSFILKEEVMTDEDNTDSLYRDDSHMSFQGVLDVKIPRKDMSYRFSNNSEDFFRNDSFVIEKLVFPSPEWTEVFHPDVEKPSQLVIVGECSFLGDYPSFTKTISFDFVQCTATKYMLGKKCPNHLGSSNPMRCDSLLVANQIMWQFEREMYCTGISDEQYSDISFMAGGFQTGGYWRSDECTYIGTNGYEQQCEACKGFRRILSKRKLKLEWKNSASRGKK